LLWKTPKRHAPGQIKGSVTLFNFVKAVVEAEAPAFECQENGLQLFLFAQKYNNLAMDEYIQHIFLPQLTQASFWLYSALLSAICQLAYNHLDQPWNKGPAQAMFAFHSDRLLQICSHALTQKALILQTYCYQCKGLLPQKDDQITVEPTGRSQHQRQQQCGGGAPPGDGRRSWCSHCQNPKVRDLCHVGPSKPDCPILGVANLAKAGAISKRALQDWEASSSGDNFCQVLNRTISKMSGPAPNHDWCSKVVQSRVQD
jgi:hypothetical protein